MLSSTMFLRGLRIPIAVSICAALSALLAPAAASAVHGVPLDHFRCYPLLFGPRADDVQVVLQDQFDIHLGLAIPGDEAALAVFVGQPTRFCNPVQKTVGRRGSVETTEIGDPDAHLTLYRVHRSTALPPVSWKLKVRNQFGEQRLEARGPVALAVPTHKIELDLAFPEDLDHFKCYAAEGRRIRRRAELADQFETELVTVLEPRLFCNPTRKIDAGGNTTGVEHAAEHLVCYDIELVLGDPPASSIALVDRVIFNQFTGTASADIVAVDDEDLLCVPSRKLAFGPHRGDDDDDDDDD
jgi:hypothetical protein